MMMNPDKLFSDRFRKDKVFFANEVLGLPLHDEQIRWVNNSTRKINMLSPGNRWGKSLIEAVKHIHHGMTKINLSDRVSTYQEWYDAPYETLNFGPGYEQAREVLRLARDIVQGNILIPQEYHAKWGRTNKSLLKDWAIRVDKSDANILPEIEWVTGARLLARSYNDMGAAFKMKALAFLSGDECADIQELWTFTNITLLPRLVSLGGILDFVGTIQPEGYDYEQMILLAQEDMEKPDWQEEGLYYFQEGSMYDNPFIDKAEIQRTERTADPEFAQQIIYGKKVETGKKYFGSERVVNATDRHMQLLPEGLPGRKYITSFDFAGGETKWSDHTVGGVLDYTEEPWRLVFFFRVKGNEMPIPMQYAKVTEICELFPGKLIIDANALGGKNAMAFLRHLNPFGLNSSGGMKGTLLKNLQTAFDGGPNEKFKRQRVVNEYGIATDSNPTWGIVRLPDIPVLTKEIKNYKLEDKKIPTDCVMMLAQAAYYAEMRRPLRRKGDIVRAFDLAALS